MRTRIVLCICITLLLMASVASATTVWNPAANGIVPPATGDWGDAANWTNGLPDAVEKAVFNVPGAAECVVTDAQSTRYWAQGDGDDGGVVRVQNGGILSQTEPHWAGVGYDSTAHMIVETGGVVNFSEHMWIGLKDGSVGTLDINGGTVNVAQMIGLGWEGTGGIGYVNVNDGLLALSNIHGDGASSIKGVSVLDIGLGSVTLPGDFTSVIGVYVAAGKITGFGGIGTLDVVFADGVTTVTAVHPLKPFPTNDSLVSPGDVELSWTLLDPCVPGQPVAVDVYFTDDLQLLEQFTDPAAIQVVNKQNVTSIVVQTQSKTWYYWAVDAYVDNDAVPVIGPIFSFFADNAPPKVDAGADIATWLEDGVMTKNLDATVTDDEAYTVQWTVISEPNDPNSPDAVITDPSAEDTVVTLSALGEYVLKLEANDGEYTGSDTVTINVYNDSCEAAKSLPDFEPLPGDINEDCIVDVLDIVILVENWLKDNSLTEP